MNTTNDQDFIDMKELRLKFAEEADEQITTLENSVLILEDNPTDNEQIELVFRVMHTLKGSGGMFGYNKISEFTHDLETIYDYVRKGDIKIDNELLDITLQSIDHLKNLLNSGDNLSESLLKDHVHYTAKIKAFVAIKLDSLQKSEDHEEATGTEISDIAQNENELWPSTYFISFKPNDYIFNNGTNPLYLLDEINSLGETFAVPHINSIPELGEFDPEKCYTWWEIFVSTTENQGTIADVFIFVEDDSTINIQKVSEDNLFSFEPFIDYMKNLKASQEITDLKALNQIIVELPEKQHPFEIEKIVEDKEVIELPIAKEIPRPKPETPAKKSKNTISSIRVSSEKVDTLMNLASEMVTMQARLSMYAEKKNDLELISIAENVQKLSKQLRDNAFSISLIPISSILTRFQRLVRDLSASLGKKVNFVIEGQGTELDKNIIERITDPLLHILRNSLDHGIEEPKERLENGKPEEGTILFKAYHSGSNINIEIKDDGAGIDTDIILRKARQNKLIGEEESLTKKQILNLIFAPGFSTATKVSDISGRGVGMDVVNKKISEIRGEVFVDSEPGKGSTITIVLPLTLSIIDGMQVKIGDTYFIIPTSAVHKIYTINHDFIERSFDNIIILEGKQIPYFYLRKQFHINSKIPPREEVLVVKYENREVGLIIDKVTSEFQTVLKPLGKHYKNLEFISGGTILGDGSVALVLDTNKIISKFSNDNNKLEEI